MRESPRSRADPVAAQPGSTSIMVEGSDTRPSIGYWFRCLMTQ
jgi:hypothetical protein